MSAKDLTGQRFSSLLVLGLAPQRNPSYPKQQNWLCRCDCGETVAVITHDLTGGVKRRCPKCSYELKKSDYTGKVFGNLTGIAPTDKMRNHYVVWTWKCTCGNTYEATIGEVINGKKHCGCLTEINKKKILIHAKPGSQVAYDTFPGFIRHNKPTMRNSSGVRGVTWSNRKKKWIARITFQKKVYYLGEYDALEEAAKARRTAEKDIYGPFIKWYDAQKLKE